MNPFNLIDSPWIPVRNLDGLNRLVRTTMNLGFEPHRCGEINPRVALQRAIPKCLGINSLYIVFMTKIKLNTHFMYCYATYLFTSYQF
jgi:hypothetical protein